MKSSTETAEPQRTNERKLKAEASITASHALNALARYAPRMLSPLPHLAKPRKLKKLPSWRQSRILTAAIVPRCMTLKPDPKRAQLLIARLEPRCK
jgi:hypothetical protein